MTARGDCLPVAFWLALETGGTLVHATVAGRGALLGVRFVHAWVELDGVATDRSNGLDVTLPAPLYRAMGSARHLHEYPPDVARALAAATGHYGPWDPILTT